MKSIKQIISVFLVGLAVFAPQTHGMALSKSIAYCVSNGLNAGLFRRSMATSPQSFKSLIDESIEQVKAGKHTPTELMLAHCHHEARNMLEKDRDGYYRLFSEEGSVVKVAKKIIELERPLQDTHYTFVHGRQWRYHAPEKVYRYLRSLSAKGVSLENWRYLNTSGVISGTDEIYMNTALFDNVSIPSSSALFYFLNNFNQNVARTSMRDVVAFNCGPILYEKHAKAINDMAGKCAGLTRYGEIILLGYPKDTVQEYVTHRGIASRDLQPPVWTGIDGTTTQDTKKIIEARRHNPRVGFGSINFAVPMMKIERDIREIIVSANDIDEEKYQEWQEQSFNPVMNELAKGLTSKR